MKPIKKIRNLVLSIIPFAIIVLILFFMDSDYLKQFAASNIAVVSTVICICILPISFGAVLATFWHLVFVRDESLPEAKIKRDIGTITDISTIFKHKTYFISGKLLQLNQAKISQNYIYTDEGIPILYSERNFLPIPGHWKIYTNNKEKEVLNIMGRQGSKAYSMGYDTFDVIDSIMSEIIGAVEPRRLVSIIRPTYILKDAKGKEVGIIKKDIYPFPAKYRVYVFGKQVCLCEKYFNIFKPQMKVSFFYDDDSVIDKRLILAEAVALCA